MIWLHLVLALFTSLSWAQNSARVDCSKDKELCSEAFEVLNVVNEKRYSGQVQNLSSKDVMEMAATVNQNFSVDRDELSRARTSGERKSLILRSLLKSSGIPAMDGRSRVEQLEKDFTAPRSERRNGLDREDSRDRSLRFRSSSTGVRGGGFGDRPLCDQTYHIECGFWDDGAITEPETPIDNKDRAYFPMVPVYKTSGASKIFIGLEIPHQYVGLTGAQEPGSNRMIINTVETPAIKAAKAQLRKLGLNPINTGQRLFGTVREYKGNIVVSNSEWKGLHIGGCGSDDFCTGNEVRSGFLIHWSAELGDIRQKSGRVMTDSLTNLIQFGSGMANGASAFDVATQTVRYGLFWNRLFYRSGNEIEWPEKKFAQLKTLPRNQLTVPETQSEASPLSHNQIHGKTAEKLSNLTGSNLERETQWRKDLAPMNDQAPVWNQPEAQKFVQSLCDDIARTHGIPNEIWPQCRIFATLLIDASFYPGGDIFITAGMLANVPNVDTLMFWISHEMAHILSRHTTLRLQKEDQKTAFYNLVGILTSALAVKGFNNLQSTVTGIAGAKAAPYLVEQASLNLLNDLGDSEEHEADRIGLEMALRMGAQKEKIIEGLKTIQQVFKETYSNQNRPHGAHSHSENEEAFEKRIQLLSTQPAPSTINGQLMPKYQESLRPWSELLLPFFTNYQMSLKSK